jgi:tetratricopeptide (TPR) repeat protein
MSIFSVSRCAVLARIVFIAALSPFFAACVYGPAVITDETTPAELIQRAQEASDKNLYSLALEYYAALLERHSDNPELVCTGEYEIAFIHYKQKKYPQAREEFNALLERYNTSDEELLPPQFKVLSNIVLERITEKEAAKDPIGDLLMFFKKKDPPAEEAPSG